MQRGTSVDRVGPLPTPHPHGTKVRTHTTTAATQVDHVPLLQGGGSFNDPRKPASRCASCHSNQDAQSDYHPTPRQMKKRDRSGCNASRPRVEKCPLKTIR
jgi:hypothetical protein